MRDNEQVKNVFYTLTMLITPTRSHVWPNTLLYSKDFSRSLGSSVL